MTESGEPLSLQDLIIRRLVELGEPGRPMSARRAADRSRGGVSYDTLYAITRGEHSGNLTDRTAQGIADALELPVSVIYEAAGVPRPGSRWLWPERFDRLDTSQRRLVEDVAGALLDAERRGFERGRGAAGA